MVSRALFESGLAAIALLLLLAGCGGSSGPATTGSKGADRPESTGTAPGGPTTRAEEHAPVEAEIELSSPVVRPEGALPARYTCDGHNQPPPLRWKKVPAGTAELMLDVMKIAPVNGRLFVAWAVAGLKPSLRAIGAGKLPAGAVVGANSLGQASYDLCPPKGPSESYVAVLLALPHKLGLQTGFDGREARDRAIHEATFESSLIFSYQRK